MVEQTAEQGDGVIINFAAGQPKLFLHSVISARAEITAAAQSPKVTLSANDELLAQFEVTPAFAHQPLALPLLLLT
jgi:hypothetical protein